MKRPILFRGYYTNDGEGTSPSQWVYGYYVVADYKHYIITESGERFEIDRHSVGQYISLLDASEKKIFEGDILKDGELLVEVEWDRANARFYSVKSTTRAWTNCEIVGNSYQNPELLTPAV